jgi:hypothetical protein
MSSPDTHADGYVSISYIEEAMARGVSRYIKVNFNLASFSQAMQKYISYVTAHVEKRARLFNVTGIHFPAV